MWKALVTAQATAVRGAGHQLFFRCWRRTFKETPRWQRRPPEQTTYWSHRSYCQSWTRELKGVRPPESENQDAQDDGTDDQMFRRDQTRDSLTDGFPDPDGCKLPPGHRGTTFSWNKGDDATRLVQNLGENDQKTSTIKFSKAEF